MNTLRDGKSLYHVAIGSIIKHYSFVLPKLYLLPDDVLADIFGLCGSDSQIELLYLGFDVSLFCRALKVKSRRMSLLVCIQNMVGKRMEIMRKFINFYGELFCTVQYHSIPAQEAVDMGILLGEFLNHGAWYDTATYILSFCHALCNIIPETCENMKRRYMCYYQLFYSQMSFYEFDAAELTFTKTQQVLDALRDLGMKPDVSGLYADYCRYQYMMSNYNEAYIWGRKAVLCLTEKTPIEVKINVLRHASKACVGKREFVKAKVLIQKAVYEAQLHFGAHHFKVAHVLSDYAYYLLNSDSTKRATEMYKFVLRILESTFGRSDNLFKATAKEDLAYSLYVSEYSSGSFQNAMSFANASITSMKQILPSQHLILCSANRVKALILEEMALDVLNFNIGFANDNMLNEAEILHKEALEVTQEMLGFENVLTAKHFGNLGRLYQTMKRFRDSEMMHRRAIEIKERLLGQDDYEVGLSIGHLASLYNYHMREYKMAEELYLRSISISLKLFGPAFSGLEYDYRGLINVYENLADNDSLLVYREKLGVWKHLRVRAARADIFMDLECLEFYSLDLIKALMTDKFFIDVSDLL